MQKKKKNNTVKSLTMYSLVLVIILGALFFSTASRPKVHELTYNELIKDISKKKVEKLEVTPNSNYSNYIVTGRLEDYSKNESFTVLIP